MLIDLLQTLPIDLTSMDLLPHVLQAIHVPTVDLSAFSGAMPHDSAIIAQQFKETNLTGDVSKAWQHFVKTGQVWAFLIGMIFGYLAKSFTSYG